jgi:outer membrane scaffolding protein for murein synthesis (MipA/OmpV family)
MTFSRLTGALWRAGLSFALLAFLGFCGAGPAVAQTPSPFAYWQNSAGVVLTPLGGPIPEWSAVATYEGGDHYHLLPAPTVDIRYRDIAFLSSGDGLGINLLRGDNYRAGISMGYDVGRSQHASELLNGIGGIAPSAQAKLFAEGFILPFVFSTDVRRSVGADNRVTGDLGIYMPVVGNETLVVFVGPGVTFADQRYMRSYFGIDAAQAAASTAHLQPYAASAGAKNANFGIDALYHVTDHWLVDTDLGVEHLLGSAGNSPLVQEKTNLGASVVIGYQF